METQRVPLTLTVEQVARRLGIGRSLAYELARRDALPAPVIRLGRRMVVGRTALERALTGEAGRNAGSSDEPA